MKILKENAQHGQNSWNSSRKYQRGASAGELTKDFTTQGALKLVTVANHQKGEQPIKRAWRKII